MWFSDKRNDRKFSILINGTIGKSANLFPDKSSSASDSSSPANVSSGSASNKFPFRFNFAKWSPLKLLSNSSEISFVSKSSTMSFCIDESALDGTWKARTKQTRECEKRSQIQHTRRRGESCQGVVWLGINLSSETGKLEEISRALRNFFVSSLEHTFSFVLEKHV